MCEMSGRHECAFIISHCSDSSLMSEHFKNAFYPCDQSVGKHKDGGSGDKGIVLPLDLMCIKK